MRIVDVLLSLPLLFVIIVFAKVFGYGDWKVILIVFSILGWPAIARLVRSLFLTLRTEVFVDAARAVGVSDVRIIFRHILPNAMSPIIVVDDSVDRRFHRDRGLHQLHRLRSERSLQSDLGQHPQQRAERHHRQGNWWWPLFPGLAIVLTVLGINFMGDGLRDALDPRSRE